MLMTSVVKSDCSGLTSSHVADRVALVLEGRELLRHLGLGRGHVGDDGAHGLVLGVVLLVIGDRAQALLAGEWLHAEVVGQRVRPGIERHGDVRYGGVAGQGRAAVPVEEGEAADQREIVVDRLLGVRLVLLSAEGIVLRVDHQLAAVHATLGIDHGEVGLDADRGTLEEARDGPGDDGDVPDRHRFLGDAGRRRVSGPPWAPGPACMCPRPMRPPRPGSKPRTAPPPMTTDPAITEPASSPRSARPPCDAPARAIRLHVPHSHPFSVVRPSPPASVPVGVGGHNSGADSTSETFLECSHAQVTGRFAERTERAWRKSATADVVAWQRSEARTSNACWARGNSA